ncbi:methyltransferase domain-containing protein [bacterium]|nr:methyltransferase domain-containing protein [bacterium]
MKTKMMNPKLAASRFVMRILDKNIFVNDLLNSNLDHFPHNQRRFITELVYGTIRNLAYIDFWIEQAAKKPLRKIDRELIGLIRTSVHQLLHMTKKNDAVVVHEAVELTKTIHKSHAQKFVNFLLREIIRLKPNVIKLKELCGDDSTKYLTTRYSIPQWLLDTILSIQLNIDSVELLEYFLHHQGITLRVDGGETERETVINHLASLEVNAEKTLESPVGIYTERSVTYSMVRDIKGVYIQDESSQLVVQKMDIAAGDTLLDLCAAPGGKTLYMSHLTGDNGKVTAVDINHHKLQLLAEALLQHNKTNVTIKLHDATLHREEWKSAFDKVMVDAPCTALGTVKRHPEVKWHRKAGDPEKLATIAYKIIEQAITYLKPGGTMLFSVCTFTQVETINQLEKFKKAYPDFTIESSGFTVDTTSDRRDLFYYFKCRKNDD